MKLYLQNIADSIQWDKLSLEWIDFDLAKFSENKTLFDYQQSALRNAIKALYKYYVDLGANKERFFELYKNNGFEENLDFDLENRKTKRIFEDFRKDYTIVGESKIAFYHFKVLLSNVIFIITSKERKVDRKHWYSIAKHLIFTI